MFCSIHKVTASKGTVATDFGLNLAKRKPMGGGRVISDYVSPHTSYMMCVPLTESITTIGSLLGIVCSLTQGAAVSPHLQGRNLSLAPDIQAFHIGFELRPYLCNNPCMKPTQTFPIRLCLSFPAEILTWSCVLCYLSLDSKVAPPHELRQINSPFLPQFPNLLFWA